MIRQRKPLRRTPLTSTSELRRSPKPPRTPSERSNPCPPVRSGGPTKPRRNTVDTRPDSESRGRRLVYARSGGWCEVRLGEVCLNRAASWHHRKNRSQGGTWSPANGLHVCGDGTTGCHGELTNTHGRRALYEERGWIVPSHADPAAVRVWRAEMWVLLLDSGDYVQAGETCSKSWYRNREAAEVALSRIWQHPWHGPGVMPSRSYLCPECRKWHLTSMPLDKYKTNIDHQEAS